MQATRQTSSCDLRRTGATTSAFLVVIALFCSIISEANSEDHSDDILRKSYDAGKTFVPGERCFHLYYLASVASKIETVDSVDALKLDLEQKQAEAAEGRKLEQLAAGAARHAVQFAMGIPQPDVRARLLAKASKACHNSEGASLPLTEALGTVDQIPMGPEQMAAIAEIAEAAAFTKNRPITQSSVQTGLLVGAEAYREDAQAHPTTPVYQLEIFPALSRIVRIGATEGVLSISQLRPLFQGSILNAYLLADFARGIHSKPDAA